MEACLQVIDGRSAGLNSTLAERFSGLVLHPATAQGSRLQLFEKGMNVMCSSRKCPLKSFSINAFLSSSDLVKLERHFQRQLF